MKVDDIIMTSSSLFLFFQVYLYSNEGLVNSAPVVYPSTRYEESDLEDGQYYVQVAPVNVAFVGLPSNLTRFVIGMCAMS